MIVQQTKNLEVADGYPPFQDTAPKSTVMWQRERLQCQLHWAIQDEHAAHHRPVPRSVP